MAVDLAALKAELKPHAYEMLTGGDDAAGERALERARVWLTARLTEAGLAADEADPVIGQILLKYALYELYSYAEQEGLAKDKKDDALELIGGYLSRPAGSPDGGKAGPAIAVSVPERKRP